MLIFTHIDLKLIRDLGSVICANFYSQSWKITVFYGKFKNFGAEEDLVCGRYGLICVNDRIDE